MCGNLGQFDVNTADIFVLATPKLKIWSMCLSGKFLNICYMQCPFEKKGGEDVQLRILCAGCSTLR